MLKFFLRRILWMIPVLLVILATIFLIMKSIPGSPWDANGGQKALVNTRMDDSTRAALDRRFGLDQPLLAQFSSYVFGRRDTDGTFVCGLICGNLGPSYRQRGRSVQDILFDRPEGRSMWESRFGYSLKLGGLAFLFSLLVGVPLGVMAATRQNSWIDYAIRLLSTLAVSIPGFVLGLLLIMTLGTGLHIVVILPTSWATAAPIVWVIPIVVLGLPTCAAMVKLVRAAMLDIMRKDFVRTARAKGLSERLVIYTHMLKNALIPVVTYSGPALVELITGSFIIEAMFGFPGMGREYIDSVLRKDYSMIMGATVIYALMIALINLAVDMTYSYIDPRIRVE